MVKENKIIHLNQSQQPKFTALLLDDDPMYCETLKNYGKKKNLSIITSKSIEEFLGKLGKSSIDLLIIDFKLQEEATGLDIVKFLAGSSPILLISNNQKALKHEETALPKFCHFIDKKAGPKAIIQKANSIIESASWFKPNFLKFAGH